MTQATEPIIYQGQFGEFTIDNRDRREVIVYRCGLMVAALCFAVATLVVLWQPTNADRLTIIGPLYSIFCLSLGVSLLTIHIYMRALHRILQVFWGIGIVASAAIAHFYPEPFAQTIYLHPLTIFGVGFVFAALTGIYFKEAVCFNRLETKGLTPLVPTLLLGHLTGLLPLSIEKWMLVSWALLFLIFAFRKAFQSIPPDIGDKSVFAYLKQQAS